MKLPSGIEIPKEIIINITQQVALDMLSFKQPFGDVFDSIKECLHTGEWEDVPALDFSDISFIAMKIVGPADKMRDKLDELLEGLVEDLSDEYLEIQDW